MRLFIYFLLGIVRCISTTIGFVICFPFYIIILMLTGNIEHAGGMLGWISKGMVKALNFNSYITKKQINYRPIGWTFRRAVKAHYANIKFWTIRGQGNFEHMGTIRRNASYWRTNLESGSRNIRFWTYVESRVDKLGSNCRNW